MAIARWKLAGSPMRSQQRVDELLSVCQACPQLVDRDTAQQRCGRCGCPVNARTDEPTSNKLAMATESCPLAEPKWTADVAGDHNQ
jgi:uncharacterized paraquat-inducible protein A